jgi:hypothetical protein
LAPPAGGGQSWLSGNCSGSNRVLPPIVSSWPLRAATSWPDEHHPTDGLSPRACSTPPVRRKGGGLMTRPPRERAASEQAGTEVANRTGGNSVAPLSGSSGTTLKDWSAPFKATAWRMPGPGSATTNAVLAFVLRLACAQQPLPADQKRGTQRGGSPGAGNAGQHSPRSELGSPLASLLSQLRVELRGMTPLV